MRRTRAHIPGIIRHPVGGGLLAVAAIAIGMLILGSKLLSDEFLNNVEAQQSQQITQLSQALHYSGLLSDDRDEARAELRQLTTTAEFDSFARQAIFGLDITRLDIYDLAGNRLYSTDAGSDPMPAASTESFIQARRGIITSQVLGDVLVPGPDGELRQTDALATFGLIEDRPPDDSRGGRPLAVISIYGDVGGNLSSIRTTMWYIVGVFFGGLAIIFFVVYRVSEASRKRLQAANDELQEQYVAVKRSRERMLAADEAAKRAIAEELHGAVQTKLYAVWMKLGAAGQAIRDSIPGQAEAVEEIAREVDDIREEDIRKLSHRLHPSIVRVGTVAALRSLRDYYEQLIPVELNIGAQAMGLESAGRSEVPEKIRLAVYRIAELALANVVKHAEAGSAVVGWDYNPATRKLELTVSDDGRGFDDHGVRFAAEASGIGLTTIDDYADALGGTLDIRSAAGRGTCLTVRFPFTGPGERGGGERVAREGTRSGGLREPSSATRTAVAGTGALAGESGSD